LGEIVIQTHNLTKEFGRRRRHRAVDSLNLGIEEGQVYGFLGPNGAGKSTTIRMLLNLMHPTSGQMQVFGRDPREDPTILRQIGALVEGATFYPYLTGWDNLMVVGNSHGGFDAERAKQLVGFVELTQAMNARVRTYSTGMKQRLGIAAALLNDPQLVILDEPTNGMDPAGIREIRSFIRSLAHEHGKTVFLTSHLLGEVQQTCDRVAIINHGKMIQHGTIDELLNQQPQIESEVSSVEKACQVLQEKWSVQPIEGANGTIRIDASREDTPTIIRRLAENNIDIFSITQYRQSLEDYFIDLIETSDSPLIPDAQGDGGILPS
jgi:ABC-2 type transport system ATP-binding protein